ncbi:MAG: hypothetical protein LBH00_04390 [Planctomycetaceae bacterium]|jgi:tetratricopeptide (TPR) repeat protein|nr:hypothetical protein [Planctomycetaceae bacterium]
MFVPDVFALDFILPADWIPLVYGGTAAVCAAVTSAFVHPHRSESADLETVKSRIAELEKIPNCSLEQTDELADLYNIWAAERAAAGAEIGELTPIFDKAEAVLQNALKFGDDEQLRRQLGNVMLNRAVVQQDLGHPEAAADSYKKVLAILKPLDDAGDGEAKLDVAGAKLNLGIIYRDLDRFEEAKTVFDESFLTFRAVEKIGVFDTRYYMAKVSVQQGGVLAEMGEPLEQITDAYNRAMRLYVEVIEDLQQVELERDLANVLLDRCREIHEDWLVREFPSDDERDQRIADVILDVRRGIELLEKQCQAGNKEARYDLLDAVALQGRILCDASKYDEAKHALDRAINEFADLLQENDDVVLMQTAMVYANRAVVQIGLGDKEASKQDCQKGSELINTLIQSGSHEDNDIRDLKEQFQALIEQLK